MNSLTSLPLEALEVKAHVLPAAVADDAQDADPEPEKGHVSQA